MSRFRQAVLDDTAPAFLAELTLKQDSSADDILRQAEELAPWVDGLQVTDNPYGWVQMSALTASAVLIGEGHVPVPVLTCRDRNRLALEADLMGLQSLGVSDLMLMRGHRVPERHSTPTTTVFDLTGRELIECAAGLNPEFFIGTGARVFRAPRGWRADSLRPRLKAGAQYVQTQLCYNVDILTHYMRRFGNVGLAGEHGLMVSLSPMPSAETARWVKQNLGDARLPEALISRHEESADEQEEGIEICVELIRQMAEIPGVSGFNLMSMGDDRAIAEVIRRCGLRAA